MPKQESAAANAGRDSPVGDYRELDIGTIDPSPLNRRYDGDEDQRVLALAADIEREGLIHPVNVRAMPEGRYEIICGEGRWRACRRAGMARIPCIVRVCDDVTAQIMRLSENLQRNNLEPLDEGEGVRALLALHDNSADEVAARLKWSAAWVRRRATLTNLSPAWREEIAKSDTPYDHIRDRITHLELIAPLPHETQDDLLASGELRYKFAARDLRAAIALRMRRLDAKPWPYKFDKDTYSGSSGRRCESCLKRSGRKDGGLFDDLVDAAAEAAKGDKSDLCLDPVCWAEKTEKFVRAQIAANPGARLLSSDRFIMSATEATYGQVTPSWQWVELAERGARPPGFIVEAKGVFVDGSRIGQVINIMLRDDQEDELDDAERHERMEQKKRERAEEERLETERLAAIKKAIPESVKELALFFTNATTDNEGMDFYLLNWGVWLGIECIRYDDDVKSDFLYPVAAEKPWPDRFKAVEATYQMAWKSIREDIIRLVVYDRSENSATQDAKRYFSSIFGVKSLSGGDADADAPSE